VYRACRNSIFTTANDTRMLRVIADVSIPWDENLPPARCTNEGLRSDPFTGF
jgi:hypothetical protein